ncbi:MAG: MotA/TolQ/ExbB proton channel family protein [Bdellovibrionales bacterium]|nr:MotA/TolQ/ExbB proton channel family protein [Bdellovibrionales bacterium]
MSFIVDIIHSGGWVSYPLMIVALLLSYLLALRYFHLKSLKPLSLQLNQAPITLENIKLIHFERSMELDFAKSIIKSLVVIAPLLGLLGTVVGMIETFESLDGMQMHSSSGGIAGGIAQAMFTTEMGLIISIPGLLVSRWLDRLQTIEKIKDDQTIAKIKIQENL